MNKKKLLALILVLLVLFATANTARAVEVVKTIRFDCAPLMVYDSYKGAVWVIPEYLSGYGVMGLQFYSRTNTVVAISDNDSSVLANFTLGGCPVAYDSALHEVYVTDENTVSVISDVSNSVVATIDLNTTLGSEPSGWVYNSGKGEMFAIHVTYGINSTYGILSRGVLVISAVTKQVVASIPLEKYPAPQGLTYDSAKGEIYVSYWSFDTEKPQNYISVISDSNNSVVATIPLGNSTSWVGSGAYDSATGEIYLPTNNNAVLVVSDKTHTVIDTILIQRPCFGPFAIAYDPVKSVLFAATGDGVFIISDRTRSVIETAPISCQGSVGYDSGKNVMITMGTGSPSSYIQFVSDASLPAPPPTPTPIPTASPSSNQNPVIPDLDWVQIAILLTMSIIVVAVVVAAVRFLRKEGAQSKRSKSESVN